ncbi:MAG: peptidoglycan D,D-transpeptidase FtsI family protein, partial [Thermodesulfobacteriota bacterium]
MTQRTTGRDWSKIRIVLVGGVFFMILGGLWARAFWVQVYKGSELAAQAEQQYWTEQTVRGLRGDIIDRKGRLLAQSVTAHSVFARPQEITDPDQVAARLAPILQQDKARLQRLLDKEAPFVWLARKVGDPLAQAVAEAHLPGIFLTEEHDRYYPQGHLAGQLLGFTGMDNQGLEGLEKIFENRLQGRSLQVRMQRDATGRLLAGQGMDPAQAAGQNVELTLDTWLQGVAEEAVSTAVDRYQARFGASLVVHVPTGEILSWAQYPFFNPNDFQESQAAIWRNRIALDVFEPGSTIKPLLVAAALEEGICQPSDTFFCENGRWKQWGHTFKDTHAYDELNVSEIIKYSSNIGAAKIGLDLGVSQYYRYLRRLGFGQESDLPLAGEASGIVPAPEKWRQVRLATSAFGQGIGVTMLQLAKAYLCLANDGRSTPLRLLQSPERQADSPKRVFSQDTARTVQEMMRGVVESNGTGTRARVPGLTVGGKTGTSQKSSLQGGYGETYVAAFVGFFPAISPEYMILTVIDEPRPNHYGGVVAAPVVKKVAQKMAASTRFALQGAVP